MSPKKVLRFGSYVRRSLWWRKAILYRPARYHTRPNELLCDSKVIPVLNSADPRSGTCVTCQLRLTDASTVSSKVLDEN